DEEKVFARQPQGGRGPQGVEGEDLLLVPVRRMRGKLSRGEVASHVLDRDLIFGEIEVHRLALWNDACALQLKNGDCTAPAISRLRQCTLQFGTGGTAALRNGPSQLRNMSPEFAYGEGPHRLPDLHLRPVAAGVADPASH